MGDLSAEPGHRAVVQWRLVACMHPRREAVCERDPRKLTGVRIQGLGATRVACMRTRQWSISGNLVHCFILEVELVQIFQIVACSLGSGCMDGVVAHMGLPGELTTYETIFTCN